MSDHYRGGVYRLSEDLRAEAVAVLVISEDDWNSTMRDVVSVPLYERKTGDDAQLLRPLVGPLIADCTRTRSINELDLDGFEFTAEWSEIDAVAAGIRAFLDLDTLIDPTKRLPQQSIHRRDWWARQGGVYYGHSFDGQREIYGVITNDEWNVRSDYAPCVFLTSKHKDWRKRWEIPISSSGFAIICDIDVFRYGQLDHTAKTKVPRLTRNDLAAVARGIEVSLEL